MIDPKSHRGTLFNVTRGYESAITNSIAGIGFGGSAIINTVSEPEGLYIISSSANDTSAGTGARLVSGTIEIVEEGGEVQQFDFEVELDGTSQVLLDTDGTGISSLSVVTTGSGNTNAGVISVKTQDTDTVLYTIPASTGTSQSSLVTMNRRSKLYQLNVYTDATTTSNVPELYEILLRSTNETDSGDFSATTSGRILATFFATPGKNSFELYDVVESGTKLWCTAKNVTNTNANAVSTELITYGV
tara:strand:+ start:146 stop:883 length:738 start_codon:yes stop_codon:yes gene_type:complete